MLTDVPLTILTPGRYRESTGQDVRFNLDDLHRMASAYSGDSFKRKKPARAAPVVVGHPEDDRPGYGSVDLLKVEGASLIAIVGNLDEGLRRGLREKVYERHAAQFFAPDNPENPEPGTWYLKHVGFMGPPPPVFSGVLDTDAEFAEAPRRREAGGNPTPAGLWGGPGLATFSEFNTRTRDPQELANRARALMAAEAEQGRHMGIVEAVEKAQAAWAPLAIEVGL